MRLRLTKFVLTFGLLGTIAAPAQAQFSDGQISALVDALEQASVAATGDRSLTDWQTENVPRWSNKCIGRSLTAEQFETSPVTARWIAVCMVRDVLKTEYRLSKNEATAIRRTAAWWNLGNPNRFNTGETAGYTQKVLSLYQQKRTNPAAAVAAAPQTPTSASVGSVPPAQSIAVSPVSSPNQPASANQPGIPETSTAGLSTATFYDRYMKAGYDATNRRDHSTALVYFKRALDERPDDAYAAQAIRNVEGYLGLPASVAPQSSSGAANRDSVSAPVVIPTIAAKPVATANPPTPTKPVATAKPTAAAKPTVPPKLTPPKAPPAIDKTSAKVSAPAAVVVIPAAPTSDAFNEQQAIDLVNRWLQAKVEIFAPPYDQQQAVNLTTGELLTSLVKANGVLTWLKANRGYFRYGVQKVDSIERFVVARERATIELNVTEDRTLYLNGTIDPKQTDFSRQRLRFTFAAVDGTWKIADYKTTNGSLLERSIGEF